MTGVLAVGMAIAALAQAVAPEGNPRAVTAEAPIVGGNAASAKERALTDAFRQVVERSFAAALTELAIGLPLPPAVAQLRSTLFSRARRYVRNYKILQQAEEGGKLRLVVDAEVDDAQLRREIDRGRGGATTARTGATAVLIVGAAPDVAEAMARALIGAGVRAEVSAGGAADEARAREAATRAGAAAAAVLTANVIAEGAVRGTPRVAASCRIAVRVLPAGGGAAADRATEARVFAEADGPARAECLARAAGELARQMAGTVAAPAPAAGRALTLDLDLIEPAALPIVLQALRKVGAAEVRRVAVGHVELRVTSRLPPAAVLAALARDAGGALAVTPGQAAADRAAAQVRMLAPTPAP